MTKEYRINVVVLSNDDTPYNNSTPLLVAPHKTMKKEAFKALVGTGADIYDPCDYCPGTNGGCAGCSYNWDNYDNA